MSRFLVLVGVSLMLSPVVTAADEGVSCRLSPTAFSGRMEEIQDLFAGNQETRELEDGYEFSFPGDGDWASRLLVLIESERQCCSFFKFELSFEPEGGPIWFRVRGSEEVKAFLETVMSSVSSDS